ncbi:MAG: nuclear transport factor 2 family protein [Actinomycetota bacterium]|nr:nuclear transport factor 2 family protein [Actinomycetota bacterium]
MSIEVENWLESYRRAWEDKDSDGAAALFSEDATYRSNIFEDPHRGREGIFSYWADVTSTQEGALVVMGKPFVDGNRVAAEFWTVMKSDGDEITLPGCLLLEFGEDGRCRSLREYWQVGVGRHEPPPEWGT